MGLHISNTTLNQRCLRLSKPWKLGRSIQNSGTGTEFAGRHESKRFLRPPDQTVSMESLSELSGLVDRRGSIDHCPRKCRKSPCSFESEAVSLRTQPESVDAIGPGRLASRLALGPHLAFNVGPSLHNTPTCFVTPGNTFDSSPPIQHAITFLPPTSTRFTRVTAGPSAALVENTPSFTLGAKNDHLAPQVLCIFDQGTGFGRQYTFERRPELWH